MEPQNISPSGTDRVSACLHGETPPACNPSSKSQSLEPIAIVGLACRLPGEVSSGSEFWDLLSSGRSGQCDFPASRFNIDGFYKPNCDVSGSLNMRGGYFLKQDLRSFENDFFGINNVETKYMDPQQRKLLEVVFECFESSGTSIETLSGSNTGCYVGNFTADYPIMQTRDIDDLHRYSMSGMGNTILSNRISHVFNLNGPSLVLDTACSASMYCLHVACAALQAGDCDGAVVAAANLIQSIEQQVSVQKIGVLSKTSTCHSFDVNADGYARADAVSALYLKRLSDAIRDGDPIRSVIRGTAVNANGKTQGISLPSAKHQEAVIRKAYAKAGLTIDETIYVECHGTGTLVGDPIEVEAVSRAFKKAHANSNAPPLRIGSVKTNIGHSEAASAISSIMKVTLALERDFIPATIGITQLNPKIPFAEIGVEVVTKGQRLSTSTGATPTPPCLLRVGVNSFGYGGANGHAILENADVHVPPNYGAASKIIQSTRTRYILPLSASTDESLRARVSGLAAYNLKEVAIQDLAHTLGSRRSHLRSRGYLLVSDKSYHEEISMDNLRTMPGSSSAGPTPSKYAFVFTGQGAQWPQMCLELFGEFPVFREAFAKMDAVLQDLPHPPTWNLSQVVCEPAATSLVMDPVYAQPIVTSIQVALVLLLQSWGVTPSAVVGHSSGEIATAFAAGFISLSEAITDAYYRGYAINKSSRNGGMIAAGISEKEANDMIGSLGLTCKVRVACVNSPVSVTISGDASAIEILMKALQENKLFARMLLTQGRAYHSHHMLAVGADYEEFLRAARSARAAKSSKQQEKVHPGATWVSSVTGDVLENSSFDHSYWRRNIESPVEFYKAVSRLSQLGDYHLIEIGPHSALELPIKQIRSKLGISENEMPYSAAITRGKNAIESVLTMVGRLYIHGLPIHFDRINGLDLGDNATTSNASYNVLHDLPAYHWNYADSPLWYEPRVSSEFRFRKYPRHELLGSRVPGGSGLEYSWKNIIRLDESPWLRDHKLDEATVFPASGYLAMVIEATRQTLASEICGNIVVHMKNVDILSALILTDCQTSHIELFTTLRPMHSSSEWWEFSITSFCSGVPTKHANGMVKIEQERQPITAKFILPAGSLESSAPRIWYNKLARNGLNFGPEFKTITDLAICRFQTLHHCRAAVPLKQELGYETYPVHPVTIEAMLQASIIATTAGSITDLAAKVPTRVGSAIFSLTGNFHTADDWQINSKAVNIGLGYAQIDTELIGPNGQVKARLEDTRLTPYEGTQLKSYQRHPMLRVLWKPDPSPGLIADEDLTNYLKIATKEYSDKLYDETNSNLMSCLSILGHKNPYLRVLELGGGKFAEAALRTLCGKSSFPQLLSYTVGQFEGDGQLAGFNVELKKGEPSCSKILPPNLQYDLIILPDYQESTSHLAQRPKELKARLTAWGTILAASPSCDDELLNECGLAAIRSKGIKGQEVMLLHHLEEKESRFHSGTSTPSVLVLEHQPTAFGDVIIEEIMQVTGKKPQRILFNDVSPDTIVAGSHIISLLEIKCSLLSTVSEFELSQLKALTDRASCIVWVTGGNLLNGQVPDHSLAFGLSRAISVEQPALKFYVYDVDDLAAHSKRTARNIFLVSTRVSPNITDFEYIEKEGVPHISRFTLDENLNEAFRRTQGTAVQMPLEKAQSAQLSLKSAGKFDRICFKQVELPQLAAGEVQVLIKSAGLSAKDFYGRGDMTRATVMLEFSGIIEKLGSEVADFKVGDRVYGMAPSYLRTSEIVPSWACHKLEGSEDFSISATPAAYATALYALHNKAGLQKGESILIHSGASGVGIAAIQIAKLIGAEIFTTVSTPEKKEFLAKDLGIKYENIFSSREATFEASLMKVTNGNGVDVVLNSLSGDLCHASWRCCGAFARFIELGKRDLANGRLEMGQFLKNATFTAFDLCDLYRSPNSTHHKILAGLVEKAFKLYRTRKVSAIPVETFDVEDLPMALKRLGSRSRIGKIAVSLERPTSMINVEPYPYITRLHSEKIYLMIGCLGGLGRSISKWLLKRGAKRFIFLGRSGVSKEPARQLIEDLTILGAECKVVQGDVCDASDVKKMIDEVDAPIGGVIQAATGWSSNLFSSTHSRDWHVGIDPKVKGTWNIHNAIKGKDNQLDFFLLTSSISGSLGFAANGAYCAANHFLDNFARYRRSQGLAAISLGLGAISEVGYAHENSDTEDILIRKGIQQFNESEMLAIIDASLSRSKAISDCYDCGAAAHILTGLELFGMPAANKQGVSANKAFLKDPRAAILARAVHKQNMSAIAQDDSLPAEISKARKSGIALSEEISKCVAKQFGDLVLMSASKVAMTRPLNEYGLDSMIASDLRSWFYQTFNLDVPFLVLLSKTTTLDSLSKSVLLHIQSQTTG
ncbi:hypothetical protein TWF506_006193 [Arthrobotrys conoides]|uniref:Polyketide synthase n=1 Tax=Arthrobotrys conoides TaxID=74498 RepID=A0AAN8NGV4_9PEZI